MRAQDWDVQVYLDSDDVTTHAHAVLHTRDGSALRAEGTARRRPTDAMVPEIGEELATARALLLLGDRLLDVAEKDVQNLSHPEEPAPGA